MVSGACEPGENTTALYVPSHAATASVLSRSPYRARLTAPGPFAMPVSTTSIG